MPGPRRADLFLVPGHSVVGDVLHASPPLCPLQWHALSREEQAKYYELARKERQLHMQLYPGWSARDNYVGGPSAELESIEVCVCVVHLPSGSTTCQLESGLRTMQCSQSWDQEHLA